MPQRHHREYQAGRHGEQPEPAAGTANTDSGNPHGRATAHASTTSSSTADSTSADSGLSGHTLRDRHALGPARQRSAVGVEPVPRAPDGPDRLAPEGPVHLVAQVPHVDVDDGGPAVVGESQTCSTR